MTSPSPLPSPLEGEGKGEGVSRFNAFALVEHSFVIAQDGSSILEGGEQTQECGGKPGNRVFGFTRLSKMFLDEKKIPGREEFFLIHGII